MTTVYYRANPTSRGTGNGLLYSEMGPSSSFQVGGGEIPPTKIEDLKVFTFHEDDIFSYRVRLTKINEAPKVCISKFWWKDDDNRFYPTKKHFWMPLSVWPELVSMSQQVTDAINELQNASSSEGMF